MILLGAKDITPTQGWGQKEDTRAGSEKSGVREGRETTCKELKYVPSCGSIIYSRMANHTSYCQDSVSCGEKKKSSP